MKVRSPCQNLHSFPSRFLHFPTSVFPLERLCRARSTVQPVSNVFLHWKSPVLLEGLVRFNSLIILSSLLPHTSQGTSEGISTALFSCLVSSPSGRACCPLNISGPSRTVCSTVSKSGLCQAACSPPRSLFWGGCGMCFWNR